jgi:hypothetical protein
MGAETASPKASVAFLALLQWLPGSTGEDGATNAAAADVFCLFVMLVAHNAAASPSATSAACCRASSGCFSR